MDFKRIEKKDLSIIKEFILAQNYGVCDFTIGGIYMWIDYFSYEYCVVEDILFIKDESNYALPLGNTSRGIEMLINEYGKIVFSGIPFDALSFFEKYNVKKELLESWSDYVYNASDLANLDTHKYIKKRDLVHQFCDNYPDYHYEELSDTKDVLLEFDNMSHKSEEMALYERNQAKLVLENYNEFDFIGGVLYVGSKAVAFTIGEIVGDTLYVHIEKANIEYRGVYQAINSFFVKMVYDKFNIKYVNREDDAGNEGLRRAKRSYHPVFMKDKYRIEI